MTDNLQDSLYCPIDKNELDHIGHNNESVYSCRKCEAKYREPENQESLRKQAENHVRILIGSKEANLKEIRKYQEQVDKIDKILESARENRII